MIFKPKEKEMFLALGMEKHVELCESKMLSIMNLYDMAVKKVFIECKTGNAVDSLRRCIVAINDGTIMRGEATFPDLIQLGDKVWEEGWEANRKHLGRNFNPYFDNDRWTRWDQGWECAEEDDDE